MHFVFSFLGSAAALILTVYLVPGVTFTDTTALIFATIVVGFVNTFIRPILRLISLPITLVTFGLFALVINAITFAFSAWLVPGFEINGVIPTLVGAIVLSIVSIIIGFFTNRAGRKVS